MFIFCKIYSWKCRSICLNCSKHTLKFSNNWFDNPTWNLNCLKLNKNSSSPVALVTLQGEQILVLVETILNVADLDHKVFKCLTFLGQTVFHNVLSHILTTWVWMWKTHQWKTHCDLFSTNLTILQGRFYPHTIWGHKFRETKLFARKFIAINGASRIRSI